MTKVKTNLLKFTFEFRFDLKIVSSISAQFLVLQNNPKISKQIAITSRAKNRLVAAQPHDQEIRTEIVDEMFLDLTTINDDDGPVPALKLSRSCLETGSFSTTLVSTWTHFLHRISFKSILNNFLMSSFHFKTRKRILISCIISCSQS